MGTTTGNLTSDQLDQIKLDMNETIHMLSDAQVNALAQQVNKAVNLPFLREEKELVVFAKVVRLIDQKLYQLLPNEYYELIKDANNGISKEEATVIEQRLTPLINASVNLPILSEKQEEKLIGLILGLIVNAMVKGFKLEEIAPKN
jgi:hypothetical protein